jgi:elongation factor 1-gamma
VFGSIPLQDTCHSRKQRKYRKGLSCISTHTSILYSLTLSTIKSSYEKAKNDLAQGLTKLNNYLLTTTYLVGNQITLADIVVASTLLYPMKLVCDKNFLKPFTNVVRWFTTCVNQPAFIAVMGKVEMCKTEALAPGQAGPPAAAAPAKKEKKKKEEKKKEVKEEEEDIPAAPPAPKVEHPYKIMDRDAKSPFSMDTWKKTYSNAATYEEAMAEFWKTFDPEGWSLWLMEYKYNEENKRIFMTSNAVGGFQQRTDEIRKWAFGVMDVLGTEETRLEIAGIWLLRGDTVEHMISANDDANWYQWTKLAGKDLALTDEVKAKITAYWTAEGELEGKPIQDSKVFK